jgi:hypothetical protein
LGSPEILFLAILTTVPLKDSPKIVINSSIYNNFVNLRACFAVLRRPFHSLFKGGRRGTACATRTQTMTARATLHVARRMTARATVHVARRTGQGAQTSAVKILQPQF